MANNIFFHATNIEFIIPGDEPKVMTQYLPGLGVTKPRGGFWCTEQKKAWKIFAQRELGKDLNFIHRIQAERPARGLVWDDDFHAKAVIGWKPTFWEDMRRSCDYIVFPEEWVIERRFDNDLAYALDIGSVVFLTPQWTLKF